MKNNQNEENIENKENKGNKEVYCLNCKKKFVNINSFNQEHDKPLFKVLKKHEYIEAENSLEHISNLIQVNSFLTNAIKMQQMQIKDLSENIKLLENFIQDIFLECNIYVKNGKTTIKNIGKCLLNFFPKSINFRIECKGDIQSNDKNNFIIEIIFPFRKAQLKQCYIEKNLGCASVQEITDADGSTVLIYSNYSSYATQKDSLISIKLLKNYSIQGKYEQKKINVIINGMLTFHSLIVNYDVPLLLYNTLEKKFLCYEDYNWKFVDNFMQNEKINEGCLISLLIDDKDEKNLKIYIKGKHKYVGFKPNYSTNDKNEAELSIIFYNKIFGLIGIYKNGNSLSMDQNEFITFNQNETHYLVCNI